MQAQTEKQTRWMATVTSTCINGELKGSCTASYIPFVWSWNKGWKVSSENRNPKPQRTAPRSETSRPAKGPQEHFSGERTSWLVSSQPVATKMAAPSLTHYCEKVSSTEDDRTGANWAHTHTHRIWGVASNAAMKRKVFFFFSTHILSLCAEWQVRTKRSGCEEKKKKERPDDDK